MLEHRTSMLRHDVVQRADFALAPTAAHSVLLLKVHDIAAEAIREQVAAAVQNATGMTLPSAGRCSTGDEQVIYWQAPFEWLIETPTAAARPTGAELSSRLSHLLAGVTDISDGLACFEVSGRGAADALMSGCGLDLQPAAFPRGSVARTAFAELPLLIANPQRPDVFRCRVERSYADFVWNWVATGSRW